VARTAMGKGSALAELVASGMVEVLPSRLSAAPSLLTARRTLYRSLWITAALPMESALAQWRMERRSVEFAGVAVMLLVLLGGGFATWYLLRMGRARDDLAQSKAVLDQALNSMASGFLMLDSQGRFTRWNRRYEDIVPGMRGHLQPLMTTRQAFELVANSLLPHATLVEREAWLDARAAQLQTRGEHDVRYPDGRSVHVSIRATPDGGTVCVFHDVTEEKKNQASLRIAATAFESQEGMLVTDAHRRILRVNHAFTEITGYSAEDVQGQNPRMLSSGRHDAAFFHSMWCSIDEAGHWQGEVVNRRKNGETYPELLTITAVKDESQRVTHYVATMLDITLRQAAAQEIERLAFHDSLTGLPNRRLLMDRLQQALAASARSSRQGALLFLDLDHFKLLNDTLGHDIGDGLLREVALRLSAAVREGDTVARLGGDEFVVLLEELSEHPLVAAEQARSVGEKICATLCQPYHLAPHSHHSSCSAGAVLFRGSDVAVEDLLKQADLAMYTAKNSGRNALRFFDPQMQATVMARALLEKDLRAALVEAQFVLHFQTQVTQAGCSVGAEVLIRWQHPARGLVSPLEFIPLAEETGLIVPIGLWVLQTACAQLKTWEAVPQCSDLELSVNVSARQFRQADFVEQVVAVLQRTGARPEKLKLELTESVVLEDVTDTIGKMQELKALGLRFALDDFGTGQSSLSYLTRLPLDQLKIDQSFVHHIGIRATDALMVQTIIGMAHNLGLQVIAEGVETPEQRAFLELHGCALYQGYLLGRPVALEQFEQSLCA
jgi:diguanylate cyclase (GGDEF)-like protein/PAS domain S-box-containing protein